MRHHHNNNLHAITRRFAMDLGSLEILVASWDGAGDATALLKMQQCKNATDVKRFHDGHAADAAKALPKEAICAKVLATTGCQEDEAHTQAFTSAANKQSCQMANLLAAYDKKVAWMAQCNAWMVSQYSAKAEMAKRACLDADQGARERGKADNFFKKCPCYFKTLEWGK